MIYVSVNDLRNMIRFKIDETIREYRQSKDKSHPHIDFPFANEDEIDNFVTTIPYYDTQLKEFLLWRLKTNSMFVSDEWFGKFYSGITCWFDFEEWLDYTQEMLLNALVNYKDGSYSKLCMPEDMGEFIEF